MIAHALLFVLAQEPAPVDPPPVEPAPAAAPAPENALVVAPEPAAVKTDPVMPLGACSQWKAPGLMEGPVFLSYAAADLGVGRRACARSEIGIGLNFGAIIDTPNFYGNLGIQGVLYGAFAINPKTELFAAFDVIDSQYVVNASLSGTQVTVGNLTVGASRQVYETHLLAGAITARLLLPTASNIPGVRVGGAEVGHNVSLRAASFLEVHGWVGVGFNTALFSPAQSLVRGTFSALVGVQLSPVSWFSLVVDLAGGLTTRTYFAPLVALRFRVFALGIELAASRPLAGDDRHDFLVAARIAFRF